MDLTWLPKKSLNNIQRCNCAATRTPLWERPRLSGGVPYLPHGRRAENVRSCPGTSDVNLFRYCDGVIHLVELIARAARSLHRLRQKESSRSVNATALNRTLTEHFEIKAPSQAAARNCGAVATLSAFLNDATLRGGLLGRMPTDSTNWGRIQMRRGNKRRVPQSSPQKTTTSTCEDKRMQRCPGSLSNRVTTCVAKVIEGSLRP